MRVGVVRLEAKRGAVFGDGPVQIALAGARCRGWCGRRASPAGGEGRAVFGDGPVQIALGPEREAEVGVRGGVVRIDFQSLAKQATASSCRPRERSERPLLFQKTQIRSPTGGSFTVWPVRRWRIGSSSARNCVKLAKRFEGSGARQRSITASSGSPTAAHASSSAAHKSRAHSGRCPEDYAAALRPPQMVALGCLPPSATTPSQSCRCHSARLPLPRGRPPAQGTPVCRRPVCPPSGIGSSRRSLPLRRSPPSRP